MFGSGKNRFLPLLSVLEWQESVLATFEFFLEWQESVLASGKNQFLPLSEGLETGLT